MAEIKVSCPQCGQHIQCDESYGGKQINCPKCQKALIVPQVAQTRPSLQVAQHQEKTYLVNSKGKQFGPYTVEELKSYLEARQLAWEDLAWCEGMSNWQPLRGIVVPSGLNKTLPPLLSTGRVSNQGKSSRKWWALGIVILLAVGLALFFVMMPSKVKINKLEAEVASDFQDRLKNNPETQAVQVKSVQLVHTSGNNYKGLIEAQNSGGKLFKIEIEVTCDGRNFMWKGVPPSLPASSDSEGSTKALHTAAQSEAAHNFEFEGIKIGASFAQVKSKFPHMTLNTEDSDAQLGLAVWREVGLALTQTGLQTADFASFSFLNGKLFRIMITFDYKTSTTKEDWKTIYQKLVARFGEADDASSDNYTWMFKGVDRYVNYDYKPADNFSILWVELFSVAQGIEHKQKAKADGRSIQPINKSKP